MKKGIHPEYHKVICKCTSCGAEFETGSTSKVQTATHSIQEDSVLRRHRVELKNSTKNTDLTTSRKQEKELHERLQFFYGKETGSAKWGIYF